jgi:nitroreductase
MNEALKVIKNRRSARSFGPAQITDEELKAVLEAGLHAPSARNRQSWFFTILQNAQLIERVNGWIIEEAHFVKDEKAQEIASTPNAAIFRRAPTVILVSGEAADPQSRDDCACAGQNMMLACEALGLGSCWISYVAFLANRDTLREYRAQLSIPSGYLPYFGLTIGYKTGPDPEAYPRKKGAFKLFR